LRKICRFASVTAYAAYIFAYTLSILCTKTTHRALVLKQFMNASVCTKTCCFASLAAFAAHVFD